MSKVLELTNTIRHYKEIGKETYDWLYKNAKLNNDVEFDNEQANTLVQSGRQAVKQIMHLTKALGTVGNKTHQIFYSITLHSNINHIKDICKKKHIKFTDDLGLFTTVYTAGLISLELQLDIAKPNTLEHRLYINNQAR